MSRAVFAAIFLGIAASPALAAEAPTQVVVIIDESPSMEPRMRQVLDALHTLVWSLAMATGDKDSVTVTVIGYTNKARLIEIHGRSSFAADELLPALAQIGIVRQGQEDGYRAIDFALDELSDGKRGLTHLLLITDEDRDKADKLLESHDVLARLHLERIVLDVMINARIDCDDGGRALGLTRGDQGFTLAEAGGYRRCRTNTTGAGFGTSFIDYAALALTSGGSVWDINALADVAVGRVVRPAEPQGARDPRLEGRRSAEALSQAYATVVAARRRAATVTQGPTARPMATPSSVWPGEAIRLSGELSHEVAQHEGVYEWAWDLDADGSPDQYGPEIVHAALDPGLYRLFLTVRGTGSTDTAPLWIRVRKTP